MGFSTGSLHGGTGRGVVISAPVHEYLDMYLFAERFKGVKVNWVAYDCIWQKANTQ